MLSRVFEPLESLAELLRNAKRRKPPVTTMTDLGDEKVWKLQFDLVHGEFPSETHVHCWQSRGD